MLSSCPRCFQVGDPMSYQRESWMMEKDEKLQTVPILHMQGNALVKQRKFREAASKYKEAVLLLKTVQSRVSEWLERKKGIWEEKWVMCRLVYFELWAFLGHATLALFQWGIPVFLFCSASLCLWLQAVGWEAVDDCLDGGILEGECVQDVLIRKRVQRILLCNFGSFRYNSQVSC